MERYKIGAYWGPRACDPASCALSIERLIAFLAKLHPALSAWSAITSADLMELMNQDNTHVLEQMLIQSALHDQKGILPSAAARLGYSMQLWNGREDEREAILIPIYCGSTHSMLLNHCLFSTIPDEGEVASTILQVTTIRSIFMELVAIWDPDWISIWTEEHRRSDPRTDTRDIFVGWMTYISLPLLAIPALPGAVKVESFGSEGVLLTIHHSNEEGGIMEEVRTSISVWQQLSVEVIPKLKGRIGLAGN